MAANASSCGNDGGGFRAWVESFKQQAQTRGISRKAVSVALDGVTYNPKVIRLDRSQGRTFKQSFEQFSRKRVTASRLRKGAAALRRYRKTLSRIEGRFGVPGPVVVALWGLESSFGANMGRMAVLRSLATLAYDCRRAEFFRRELMAALRIVERGHLRPRDMRGGWAGEMGQTQFMPTSYIKYAVDFDGNGRANLLKSVPDVLASTANYLRGYGWQRGQPWGRGTTNFRVIQQWNKSEVYARTVAYFANKLADKR